MIGNNGPIINDGIVDPLILRWQVSPIVIWSMTSVIPIALFALLSIKLNSFYSTSTVIGFVDNYNFLNNFLLGVPTVCTFYYLLPRYFKECFDSLANNKVIGASIQGNSETNIPYSDFTTEFYAILSRKRYTLISFVLSGIFMAIAIPQHLKGKDWLVNHLSSFVIIEIIWFALFALVALMSIRIIMCIHRLNRAFREYEVLVRPLFPDSAGGLQPLSDFSLRIGYIMFFFGLELGANQYFTAYVRSRSLGTMEWSPDTVIPWIIYLVLAPLVFFLPLNAAHDSMKKAKDRHLLDISRQYECDYTLLKKNLSKDTTVIKGHISKLEELQKLYDVVKRFPVWPFDISNLARFFTIVLSPLFMTAFTNILTSILGKYAK